MSDEDLPEFGIYVEFAEKDGTLNISFDEVPIDCLKHIFTTEIADAVTITSMDLTLSGDDDE